MTAVRALVTGATGGIGRAICLALVEQARRDGADIRIAAAASRPGPALDALVAELTAAGAAATGVCGDLTDPDSCAALVAQAGEFCGGLTLLVSNAGASGPGRLADLSVEQWDATFALNVRATWLLARAARPLLAGGGSVVAIASMSGLHPHPGYGAYSPAKAALTMLCRQLAQEWADMGIRVNTVCPGMIRTPLTEAVYRDESVKAQREVLVPAVDYETNDAWPVVRGTANGLGAPLLLMDHYGHGNLFVLTIPDDFNDLYNLPQPVLTSIKSYIMQDFPVQMNAPSQVSLFAYNNGTFVVESYRNHPVKVTLSVLGKGKQLENLLTGKVLQGEGSTHRHIFQMPGNPVRTSFTVTVEPHSYVGFKTE